MSAVAVVLVHNYYVFAVCLEQVVKLFILDKLVYVVCFFVVDIFHILPDEKAAVFGTSLNAGFHTSENVFVDTLVVCYFVISELFVCNTVSRKLNLYKAHH